MIHLDNQNNYLAWVEMEKQKPEQEWIYFIPKDEYQHILRGYALPEHERVVMKFFCVPFDKIDRWMELKSFEFPENEN